MNEPAAQRPVRPARSTFKRFVAISTRWGDNDVYGHVNNVQYYAFFDTAVNQALIEEGLLDIGESKVIGLVVDTSCTFFESLKFPDRIEVGLAMERTGSTSLTYRIGIFRQGSQTCAAAGRFVHVYVDRRTQRPVPLPEDLRAYADRLATA